MAGTRRAYDAGVLRREPRQSGSSAPGRWTAAASLPTATRARELDRATDAGSRPLESGIEERMIPAISNPTAMGQ